MTMPTVREPCGALSIDELVQRQAMQRSGHWLHLPEHRVTLSDAEATACAEVALCTSGGGFDPPWVRELAVTRAAPRGRGGG